jgi:DNA-binding NarL/FixJ family response regulator
LLGECPGAATPGLTALAVPELTPREHEIAELATRGLANAEIAERLVVSVRTVEWHLQQVYGKLGVDGREEIPDVLVGGAGPKTP